MKRTRIALVAGLVALPLLTAGTAGAHGRPLKARDDAYRVRAGHTLDVGGDGVLGNDRGAPVTLVSHGAPAHGALDVDADGSFRYTPEPGFTGTDSFTYSVSDAVRLYRTHLPPLATIGGVQLKSGAYGSGLTAVPGSRDEFYGLTDRGPNVDGPNGEKIEPLPAFDPAIGKFRLTGGKAVLEKVIPLRAADGTPYSGRVSPEANTGEKIVDLNGTVLAPDKNGYDSEGLVAQRDGTFWVSDEYGPYITQFDRTGRALQRLSPFDGSLPRELANRVPNKGMEGLTLTPDGRTLVGIMQSALQQPDLTKKPSNVTTLRIVTVDLTTRATHEYLYLLDNPKTTSGAVSEITALSATRFLVDERDGHVEPGANKKLFEIDLTGATDVGPAANVPGAVYDATKGGLLVGDQKRTLDAHVGTDDTATATTDLAAVGIRPVAKKLSLDVGALVTRLDPTGGFFGHDKVEGVATTDGGRTLVISNDNDFGVDGVTTTAPPYGLHPKTLPNGRQDDGEYLVVDTTKLPAALSTATVTIQVRR
ncbi:esterase-like activity of phytase family protein [Amycolatopsis sp. H20-H5]|uniref:esterase-like activity of phytase family protein n=1 Tax=Amycolatopsis sp. H20-H5 TaxID=3046309 RepID=UPI002DB7FB62|nr:esterase-like activity of phytase family protein [Amycolatopsis sp. H20-H5]MEC3977638.1 esterase-like activity of phytase family protein [Amycolatopsis sp. H20-H5]